MTDQTRHGRNVNNSSMFEPKASTVQYSAVPKADGSDHDAAGVQHGTWLRRLMLDTWAPEFMAIMLSAGCMLAIFGFLLAYRDKPTPSLPYDITFNAVVSTLATASRSLLLYTVAAAIGQLKWCWHQQREPRMQDMQAFDNASRGP